MTDKPEELSKAYQPKLVESKWYQFWLDKGYFTPQIDPARKPFVIIMPPPNVTGELHLGHALTATLEDIMTRWHRMRGESTLWLPGIDHAGIAAQLVVERELAKEGLTRQQLGRERFLERMWQWINKYGRIIAEQHKRLGASCDWNRERFTLDKGPSRAVRTTFVNLYRKGLIYRGERIINWCPRCATALSDLEVEHRDLEGHLYYLRYPLADEPGFITVATTRPETMLGDTAVAVNPKDERYKNLVGKKAILPRLGRHIAIIADEAVDIAFGTGAVKITPAHDPVDFEMAQRRSLELINILNPDATMNRNAGPYEGMERFACRRALLADLEREGLLVKTEPYHLSVGHCERCNTIVEPLASQQWFVKIEPLAKPAIQAVLDGRIKIIPEHFTKVYLNWMENLRDWCISRQLWWGHRIPVWYCQKCGQLTVAVDDPAACANCGSKNIEQDPDVLDTWFSSALWPHSTLGWPEDTEDLRHFYPTSVMETGYDILFFWVARMIMMGLENTGQVPFHTVYLHGLIRDEHGEKMSKLKGNVLNPLELIDRFGTDALRFALTTGSAPGNDIRLSPSKLEASRNFANKLWNAARFVMRSLPAGPVEAAASAEPVPTEDRWIISRLNRVIGSVNTMLQDFQFGEAQRQIYDFLWGEYCDWYIEIAKLRLNNPQAPSPLPVLTQVLENSLRLLHPFTPFITEEIWQTLRAQLGQQEAWAESIMLAPYPTASPSALDPEAEREMASVIEIVRSIRNVRAQFKVEPARWLEAHVFASVLKDALQRHSATIEILGRARPVIIKDTSQPRPAPEEALSLVLSEVEVAVPLAGMVDLEAERRRLSKELAENEAEIGRLEKRLADSAFIAKAPAQIVERERGKLATQRDKLERLREQLARLG